MTGIAFAAFALFSLLGLPLAFAIGIGAALALALSDFPLDVLAQRTLYAVDFFPPLSVPLFMLAGELMVKGGIMDRLIGLANSVVGRVRGGSPMFVSWPAPASPRCREQPWRTRQRWAAR